MDKRVFLLALAAGVIGGLCAFKATRHYAPPTSIAAPSMTAPAPEFELYDQNHPSHLARLEGYLGRQRVIIAFFDGNAGAHASLVLNRLRTDWGRLRKADIYVLAISTALPQENRKDIAQYGEFPFPLLSDPDFHVHREWGCFDKTSGKPRTGVYLVDRKGWTAWSRRIEAPQPVKDWDSAIEGMIAANEI